MIILAYWNLFVMLIVGHGCAIDEKRLYSPKHFRTDLSKVTSRVDGLNDT